MAENWPMGIEEARKYRAEMMKEHWWMNMARYGRMELYGF